MRLQLGMGYLATVVAWFFAPVAAAQYTHSSKTTIAYTSDVTVTANTGSLVIGSQTGSQIALDNNEIQARNGSTASALYLQNSGGDLMVGPSSGRLSLDPLSIRTEKNALGLWVDGARPLFIHRPDSNSMHATFDVDKLVNWGELVLHDRLYMTVQSVGGSSMACFTSSGGFRQLGLCSSSARFKRNVVPVTGGLGLVLQMKPVAFTWKETGQRDYGFIAEDAAEVLPELATKNDRGVIQGFAYHHYTAVLTQAVQEQQRTIEALQQELTDSTRETKALELRAAQRVEELEQQLLAQGRRLAELESAVSASLLHESREADLAQ